MDATEKEPAILKNSPKIPGYTILSRLGEGGMAVVYLAIQESFGRKVALKVMMPKSQDDPSYGERFLREAKIVARLSHPHIVPVYDVGSAGDYYYISMEYLDKGDLTSRLKNGLDIKGIINVTKDVAAALDYAHRKGIIHRDVKPDNIMFREDGAAVLTDFGIARPTSPDSNMTQVGKVIGTPKYMSPEQTKGEVLDNTCDLYALGIMLYEMLTGNVPFDGENPFDIGIKHLKDPVPKLPNTLNIFQPLIDSLLVKNKTHRLQAGHEVIAALDDILLKIATKKTPMPKLKPNIDNSKTVIRQATPGIRANINDRSEKKATSEKHGISKSLVLLTLLLLTVSALAGVWLAPTIAPNNSQLMALHYQLVDIAQFQKTQPKPAVTATRPAPKPVVTPTPIENNNTILIKKYLDEAKVAVALGNYATPEGESALDHYRNILNIDADNIDAKLGIADIAAKLITQTNEAINLDNFEKAHELIAKTKNISENIPGLSAAESLLLEKEQALIRQQELAEQQRIKEEQRKAEAIKIANAQKAATELKKKAAAQEQTAATNNTNALFNKVRVNGLLAKADTFYARGDYYKPARDNALTKYKEVLSLDANNSQAQRGIDKVIGVMMKDIHDRLLAQEAGAAQQIYKQAIEAAPNDSNLQLLGRSKGW